jgi:hypothetical protein
MRRSTLKFREDEIFERLKPLIYVAQPTLVFVDRPDLSFISDSAVKAKVHSAVVLLGAVITAFLQLHSVYEDAIITFKMSRRFPWRKSEMKKSRHLGLVWFQFINQCYLFEEKVKLFSNCYNRAFKAFGRKGKMIDVAAKLKLVEKNLGKQIRARGASFHEWYEQHAGVRHFEMIEIINSPKRVDGPLGDIEGHYSDAKFFLSMEIREAIVFMENFLISIFDDNIEPFIELVRQFNSYVQKLAGEADGAQVG